MIVSLTAVDLGGNDTDEKIPAGHFLKDIDEFLQARAGKTLAAEEVERRFTP